MSTPTKAPRRFVPQPVESSTRSSKNSAKIVGPAIDASADVQGNVSGHSLSSNTRPARKFKPEPVETSTRSSRTKRDAGSGISVEAEARHRSLPQAADSPTSGGRRKFVPQLIETSQWSRKSGESPLISPSPRGSRSPHLNPIRGTQSPREQSPTLRMKASLEASGDSSSLRTPPRQLSTLRQHSFQVPNLESIESSESDESKCPSLSTSPSAPSEENGNHFRRTRKFRESYDDGFRGYMLGLAAKTAEKQLREQAMAAFPNSDFHEPVEHFAYGRESDESGGEEDGPPLLPHEVAQPTTRQDSANDVIWELREMRKHHEKLERQRGPLPTKPARVRSRESLLTTLAHQRAGGSGHDLNSHKQSSIGGIQRGGGGIGANAAITAKAPPMLGRDLEFPKCLSPQASGAEGSNGPMSNTSRSQWCNDGVGLWRGLCVAGDEDTSPPEQLLGLKTPAVEKSDPFLSYDQVLEAHQKASDQLNVEQEVSDEFVTQVYCYLSLKYPSIARKFDFELSRISRVPVEELRRDDGRARSKGLVSPPEDGGDSTNKGVAQDHCARWKALRIYIQEWTRQHPDLAPGNLGPDAWGMRPRRGSWAF
ncbi:MAG: hypothetical protein M1823_003527 [Watsoniomyces obsoletus]|nr:MAG: hypothetical protein M1823_003527 [Watsoniomyces obsoletus]